MTTKIARKLFHVPRLLRNGKFNVLEIDPDDPSAGAKLCVSELTGFGDMTEAETREWYRTKLNLSDVEIDKLIATARREFEKKRAAQ